MAAVACRPIICPHPTIHSEYYSNSRSHQHKAPPALLASLRRVALIVRTSRQLLVATKTDQVKSGKGYLCSVHECLIVESYGGLGYLAPPPLLQP